LIQYYGHPLENYLLNRAKTVKLQKAPWKELVKEQGKLYVVKEGA
jgi:hypothetical protein